MEEQEELPVYGREAVMSLVSWWVAGAIVLAWLVPSVDEDTRPILSDLRLNVVFYLPAVLWLWVNLRQRRKRLASFLGDRPAVDRLPWILWVGAGLVLMSVGGYWLMWYPLSFVAPGLTEWQLSGEDIFPADGAGSPWAYVGVQVVGAVILAPIVEEMVFRGVIMRCWAERWGVVRGVVLSSLFFALLHFDVLGVVVFACFMCALYFATRTLWVPILVHAAHNLLVFVWASLDFVLTGPSSEYTIPEFRADTTWMLPCLAAAVAWLWFSGRRLISSTEWRLSRLP